MRRARSDAPYQAEFRQHALECAHRPMSLIFVVAGSVGKSVCLDLICGRARITNTFFMGTKTFLLGFLTLTLTAAVADETNSNSALLSGFMPVAAPEPTHLILRRGDRVAICGDSITEQKMYSRIMEDYLTMCVPQLNVTVRQYGWSGERAPQFLKRMTNDVLRFEPTVATTCYGMNDHEYRTYQDRIGNTYRTNQELIVSAFQHWGVRVVLGSAGCVGKVPSWQKDRSYTVDQLNSNLGTLRNIDAELATRMNVGFADVFWPMLNAGTLARQRYGTNFNISGADGVHPNWAGHTVMAYAFLKGMGLDGEIGTFTVDIKKNEMKTTAGHEVVGANTGEFQIKSSRYPFCPCEPEGAATRGYPVCGKTEISRDDNIEASMALVPFNQELNRLTLLVKNGTASHYYVTWGGQSKKFSTEQLAHGINLIEEFPSNPFAEAFAKVDAAVATKQEFETKEMKTDFHGNGNLDAPIENVIPQTEKVVKEDEKKHDQLAAAVSAAFVPVTHILRIDAE
jgi:lysophospholipase L1-like esterase